MQSPETKRIHLVTDRSKIGRLLRNLLSGEPDLSISGISSDLPRTAGDYGVRRPHVVIVAMTERDGIAGLLAHIRREFRGVAVLILTPEDDPAAVVDALRAGAGAYVTTASAEPSLVNAIRHLLAGEIYVDPRLYPQVLGRMLRGTRARRRSPAGGSLDAELLRLLDDVELQVFSLIGNRIAEPEIARTLGLSLDEVVAGLERLRTRLGLHSRDDLARLARRWIDAREANS